MLPHQLSDCTNPLIFLQNLVGGTDDGFGFRYLEASTLPLPLIRFEFKISDRYKQIIPIVIHFRKACLDARSHEHCVSRSAKAMRSDCHEP